MLLPYPLKEMEISTSPSGRRWINSVRASRLRRNPRPDSRGSQTPLRETVPRPSTSRSAFDSSLSISISRSTSKTRSSPPILLSAPSPFTSKGTDSGLPSASSNSVMSATTGDRKLASSIFSSFLTPGTSARIRIVRVCPGSAGVMNRISPPGPPDPRPDPALPGYGPCSHPRPRPSSPGPTDPLARPGHSQTGETPAPDPHQASHHLGNRQSRSETQGRLRSWPAPALRHMPPLSHQRQNPGCRHSHGLPSRVRPASPQRHIAHGGYLS